MAEATSKSTAKKAPKRQAKGGNYYIVNPAGAVHGVTKNHAAWRLKSAGWRLAEEDEIEKFLTPNKILRAGTDREREIAVQEWDNPICKPFTSDPDELLAALDTEEE